MTLFKTTNDLCDCVSAVVFCGIDNTMMLTVDGTDHWIPTVKVPPGQSWSKAIAKEIQEIFGINNMDKLFRLTKTWIPRHTVAYLLHAVYLVSIDPGIKNKSRNSMGKYRGKLRWVSDSDLTKLQANNNLKSPEILDFFNLAKSVNVFSLVQPEEVMQIENFAETCDDILVSGKGSIQSQLIESSGIDKLAQEALLKEFIYMVFPASYMSLKVFSKFVPELGWPKEHAEYLFNAADLNCRCGLSFREFLYFLATVDPNTSHGGAAAEIRCRYMFRYYDRDRDNLLKPDEFKNVISDLRKVKKLAVDAASVCKEANDTYKVMGMTEGASINIMEFLKAICDLKIRGTSTIFRSLVSSLKYLGEKCGGTPRIATGDVGNFKPSETLRLKTQLKPIDYEVAVHTVKIQRSGQAINIDEMRQIQEAVSLTTMKQPVNEQARRISLDLFSQRSVSNEVLKSLRYLTSINKVKDSKPNYTWGQLDVTSFGRNLINVCNQVREIFKSEPRLLELNSPVYIMGDLHGNVSDLLYFERTLWHIGPGLSPCNLLFLGDYVDRGAYSMEVISYLFSYKLQSPNKVNLLRGNHEIREIQKMFTFYKECVLKLGEKLGNEVWMAVNNAFDALPISAVIDGKLFCCHGGVPPPWLCPVISAINDIPSPLSQPDSQSSLAWELMWNDPVRPKTVNEKLAMELLANEGFAVNVRRGTAHIFSVEALERFLKANGLSHLVRAHEVAQAGFQVQQKGKLLTVFSSSKYCGGQNDAACVMADQGKLRILRLETD